MTTTMQPRVTIARIAKEAAAAKSTVSCVLNGKLKESGASAARIQQIQEVARRLNYRPSAAARAMRTGRFNAIGLMMSAVPGRSSPFIELWLGVLAELHTRNLSLNVARLPDEELAGEGFVPRLLGEWAVDGLLIDPVDEAPERMVQLIRQHHIPSVWLNTRFAHDCVYPDDVAATRQATEHLLRLGHTRIAYRTDSPTAHHSHADRQQGYEEAMLTAGLSPWVHRSEHWLDAGQRLAAARAVLARADRPSAILTYHPEDCLPYLTAALERGMQVPRDLSLVTIASDLQMHTGFDLATLLIPANAMGRAAVRMLLDKVRDPGQAQPSAAIPCVFHHGNTLAPPPAP
jgi:LacI family transcriptional regulator